MIINILCNPAGIFQGYCLSIDRIYFRTLKNTSQNVSSKIAFYQGYNEHARRCSDVRFCAW